MKPILFSTPMVQALLNTKPCTWPAEPIDSGRPFKSKTRRAIKPQPGEGESIKPISAEGFLTVMKYATEIWTGTDEGESVRLNPRYQVGDKLWVRETFYDGDMQGKMIYRADGKYDCDGVWKPSIHMPRYAARLFLEVRELRAERLHSMKKEEAVKEGISPNGQIHAVCCPVCKGTRWTEGIHCPDCRSVMVCFSRLWNAINGKGAWESNPWVWVYEFMRVEG